MRRIYIIIFGAVLLIFPPLPRFSTLIFIPLSSRCRTGITDTLKKEEVFSVVYDGAGDDIYIAYGDVKYKAENADLLEALVSEAPKRRRLQKQPPIGGDERR